MNQSTSSPLEASTSASSNSGDLSSGKRLGIVYVMTLDALDDRVAQFATPDVEKRLVLVRDEWLSLGSPGRVKVSVEPAE